ncbi:MULTISPECIES: hypothetical protein [Sorangium]|uniref:Uncharacterized protein n=1 Tax=Sorangium cellulosum TaxID=56 RepID=A0A4P2QFV9_SORCE|nr:MULTISPECIES: hypothetical protein [Sorangium]AUX28123.1 uncharacterized protein SOCE836_001910 [Sorangium cellulosum]WCQ87527.1 hypothetical protein NQZ70_00190 [Sorangium sp. Soce836]
MPLVAVAPTRHAYGVECDADDWRAPRGSAANCREHRNGSVGVEAAYRVMDLGNALVETYNTDAHLVPYVLRDEHGAPLVRQPRVNKAGLDFVRRLGFTLALEALLADVDNPGHCEWTPELLALAAEQDERLETAGVYYTAHGRRIVQPLARPVPIDQAEGVLAAWLGQLERLGLHPDPACRDWTRHFRLPHVRRGKRDYRSPIVHLERMRPVAPPAPDWTRARGRRRSTGALGPSGDVDGSPLARAFEATGWLGPSLGAGKRAVLCPWRTEHTVGRDFDSSTVLFGPGPGRPLGWWHCSHGHCAGRTQADVLRALPPAARALLRASSSPVGLRREIVPADEARRRLEGAFQKAPDGLSVVVAGCGTGKTEAAIVVACERARKAYASQAVQGKRAPAHSKTAISVPTQRLAIEVAGRLQARGVAVRRLFGPLSVRREDGSPECRFHDQGVALARGGQSIPWELCEGRGREPCEFASACRARGGVEGPDDARVIVGPHALLGQLSAAAGATGELVIDEPPAVLVHEVLTVEEFFAAERGLGAFEARYAAAMRVSLRAVAAWIDAGPLDQPGPLARAVERVDQDLLTDAYEATGATDALEAARAAFDEGHRGTAPPVRRAHVFAARRSLALAQQIGAASRVLRLVWLGLTSEPKQVIARLEQRRDRRVLVLTLPDVQLLEALRRSGAVVIADANARLHLPIYEHVVGYRPPVTEAHAQDGAPVRREMLRTRATRNAWAPRGRIEGGASLVRAVRAVVRWVLRDESTRRVALVTLRLVELVLRAALGQDVSQRWVEAGQSRPELDALRDALGAELARLPESPDLGHYGAIEGLDHWRDHDALVTLGDPWPQLTDARWEAEFLGLPDWDARYEALCAAELEQAHGRLRTVHRTRPARALHVGSVVPSGWQDFTIVEDAGGRPTNERGVSVEELRRLVQEAGGRNSAAKALDIGRATLTDYLTGKRGAPGALVAELRKLAADIGRPLPSVVGKPPGS